MASVPGVCPLAPPAAQNEKLAAPECTFSRDQNGHSLILEVSTEEVARLMTALDHELMSRINPLEYIYHIFKVKGANAVNLSTFTSRFNQVPCGTARAGHCAPD